jgi:p-aminobenzoyl-glutamate transporter AbgT
MKILFFVVLTLINVYAHAQTFLSTHETMSPFCKTMVPLMGLFIVGAIGYGVVKAIRGNDKDV